MLYLNMSLPQQGNSYLEKILENDELHLSIQDWEYILRNDTIGGPSKAQYNISNLKVECSPTTLRYVKVLSDISKLFPESILQGGGYVKLV